MSSETNSIMLIPALPPKELNIESYESAISFQILQSCSKVNLI